VKRSLCSLLCAIFGLLTYSIAAQTDYQLKIVRPKVVGWPGQQFLCVVPYTTAECEKQTAILQTILHRYQAEKLGQWTWVLVRSEDWKPILERVHMNPNSPAFSILERRQTFFEEVLVVPKPGRQVELLSKWNIGFDQFLDFAVTHELGHALCNDPDEVRAEQFGQRLRKGRATGCETQHRGRSPNSR
jgi:hypothetical protein